MAVTNLEDDVQPLDTNWQYKISGIDIELKGKQFMNDELEYYKEVKTKPKKNAYAERKNLDAFVEVKAKPRSSGVECFYKK